MINCKKPLLKSAALLISAAILLCGCQEGSVIENGDLPQSVDAQNDLTTTTAEETTTTEETSAPETTTTTTTTTTTAEETTAAPETEPEETSAAPETQPATAAPTTELAAPATYEPEDEHIKYNHQPINVRSGPGTNYSILGVLSGGSQLTVIGSSGDWYAISYNGGTGYVLSSLLSNNPPAQTAAPAVTAAAVVTTARTHVCGYRGGNTYPEFKHDLQYMYDLNSDFIGWLKISDTPIDGPVVQATDNKFYLEHDFYGRLDNTLKCVTYADYHVPVTKDSRPQNLILYGHNISSGAGLAKVSNYNPNYYGSLNFYLTHPTIRYESIYGGEYRYVVFAGMFVNTETRHGPVFNYHKYRDFGSQSTFYQYFEAVFDRSVFYNPGIDISYDDEFLTISTCWYPLGIDTRFVLFCRKLRNGESPEIDVSKAYINKSPLYFDYYYQVNGGKWAGRSWSPSLMKGYKDWLDQQNG